jgi:hypothetical protein
MLIVVAGRYVEFHNASARHLQNTLRLDRFLGTQCPHIAQHRTIGAYRALLAAYLPVPERLKKAAVLKAWAREYNTITGDLTTMESRDDVWPSPAERPDYWRDSAPRWYLNLLHNNENPERPKRFPGILGYTFDHDCLKG